MGSGVSRRVEWSLHQTRGETVRRRVQQDTLGYRGHAGDPRFRIRNILRAGGQHLTDKQWDRFTDCLERGDPDGEA